MSYMDRYKKPPLKPEPSTFEDEIVGRPVPFEPDVDGNWESVLSELFTNVDEVADILKIKLNDPDGELDYSRFREFCENYKTKRGKMMPPTGQILSAQTYFDFGPDQARTPFLSLADFKFAKKLAKRLAYQTYFEHQLGVGSETITNASWSRTQVFAEHAEKWDLPVVKAASELEERTRKSRVAATDSTANEEGASVNELRATVEKSVAFNADDVVEKPKKAASPVVVRIPDDDGDVEDKAKVEAALSEDEAGKAPRAPGWEQLVLNQGSPWSEGALRFTGTMGSCERYPLTSPPPRNVILGRLPPKTKLGPRSDLQNTFLTICLPLRGINDGCAITVHGETRTWVQDEPIIFDSTFEYSLANDGDSEAYVLLIDFWHPDLTELERRLLGFFWSMWTQDKFHPSVRSRYTRRLARMKEYGEKLAEKRRAQIALPKKRLEERKKRQQGGPGAGGPGGGPPGGNRPGGGKGGGFFSK